MIWSIAWKNIWRNKQRSLVVMFSIMLGLVGGTFTAAFIFGMADQKINASINKEVSHIQLHNPKYLGNNEVQYSIDDAATISEFIRSLPEVKAVSERTKTPGMVNCSSISSGVQIVGIDPEIEKKTTTIHQTICDTCGKYFEGIKKNPVVISQRLAKKLNVKLRSKIVLQFPKSDGTIQLAAFKISGIYKTSNSNFDLANVFVRNKDLADSSGQFFKTHEIAVLLNSNDSLSQITSLLKTKYPQLSVMTWKELQPELALFDDFAEVELYIILGIILFALAFGIINTMLMVVLERVRELGMLMAIGMNRLRVFNMIMLETVMLTLTGGIIGMIISWILIVFLGKHGIDLSAVSEGMEAFGVDAIVYPTISFGFYMNLTIMIIITGIIASIYPARKALKLKPVDAIREE
jgi:putative ABC transport system permease protein